MQKINLLQRIKKGIRKGWNTPTLPHKILQLESNPIIRLLRIIGGISIGILISRRYILLPSPYLYICMFFSSILAIYLIVLFFYRLIHIFKSIKDQDLDIRN